MVLIVTHVGEGGIGSRTRREDGIVSDVGDSGIVGRMVVLVTHVGEGGIVSDTCRGGRYC
jgi:hypothetical protein